jgi:HAD superfamily hydrolase (TIGR01484 family)
LATDYDGTLAHDGVVQPETCDALRRFKATGRKLLLVTGRELPALKIAFPEYAMFDSIVAENGALLYDPATGQERLLGPEPSRALVDRLKTLHVEPLSVGRGIIATWEPHQTIVLEVIRELGLELQIVFNKSAVMVLPSGVSKASGLREALQVLDLSPINVVAVGDAENDHTFLRACGCSAAVANAIPPLRLEANIQLTRDHGAGVAELIDSIIQSDVHLAPIAKHGLLAGRDLEGSPIFLEPRAHRVLVLGPSGSGKSTFATMLTERMIEKGLDFLIVDPEGDYWELKDTVCVGSAAAPPELPQALKFQHDAVLSLVINTQALTMDARRALLSRLIQQVAKTRAATGRPHWMMIDEAHEFLAAVGQAPAPGQSGEEDLPPVIMITMFPQALSIEILRGVDVLVVFGAKAAADIAAFAQAVGLNAPTHLPVPQPGEALYWDIGSAQAPILMTAVRPMQEHKRHNGKYATGDVGRVRSFYFRGPHGQVNIPANNLYRFIEVAADVDDRTWEHHLRAGDYSAWFRHVVKDEELACEAEAIERNLTLTPAASRKRVKKAIWRRYAAPCDACWAVTTNEMA